ncbi:MAG: hypothetical protein U0269_11745 [Polyangiales bacterium]
MAPRTQIVVAVDTDYAVPAEVGSLRVTVLDPAGGENTVRAITLAGAAARGCADGPMPTRFCIPLSFLLVPKTGRVSSAPVNITVEAIAGTDGMNGRALIARSARIPFAMGQTLRLPMFLPRACEGVVCGDGLTCVEGGRCVPVDQPPGVVVIDPTTGLSIDASGDGATSAPDVTLVDDATASDAMMVRDVMTGMRDVMTGMPDVMTGMPDVMTGMRDVMTGMPDVMTGMPDVMTGMPDVMGGGMDASREAGGADAGSGGRDSGRDEESGRADR